MPHAVALTYVANRHGALGFFGDRAWLLVVLALVVLCAVAVLFRDSLRRSAAAQIGYGLVAGGALGNVVDRIVHGYVVDFIALAHLFVFNVADACISAGLALMALPALRSRGT